MGELAGADLSPHDLGLVGLPAQGAQRVGREGLGLWMMAGQGAGKGGPTSGGATPYLFDPPLSHAWKGAKAITSKSPQSTGLEVRETRRSWRPTASTVCPLYGVDAELSSQLVRCSEKMSKPQTWPALAPSSRDTRGHRWVWILQRR